MRSDSDHRYNMRIAILTLCLFGLVAVAMHFSGCPRVEARSNYAAGDTIKIDFAVVDTLFQAADPSADSCLVYRWFGLTRTLEGVATAANSIRDGAEGYYWISDSTDAGEYAAYLVGQVDGRQTIGVYPFTIDSPPAGPAKVNLWFMSTTDTSGIADVDVRIKDENQTNTLAILTSNSSGKIVTALPADTAKVIASKLGHYTFTVPETIIVTASGLTDTLWGTAFDPGTPDSSDVTRVYGWCRDLGGSIMPDVIVTVRAMETYTDWGSPGTSPTLIVMRQAVRDTTDSNGKFSIDLICADQVIPEGGSTGNVRHVFEFSKPTYVGPRFVGESDTLYIPCTNQSYSYWNAALRP